MTTGTTGETPGLVDGLTALGAFAEQPEEALSDPGTSTQEPPNDQPSPEHLAGQLVSRALSDLEMLQAAGVPTPFIQEAVSIFLIQLATHVGIDLPGESAGSNKDAETLAIVRSTMAKMVELLDAD